MIEDYIRPVTMEETLSILSKATGQAHPLAGGTDLLLRQDKNSSTKMILVDITEVPGLAGITSTSEGLNIGSATRLSEVARSSLLTGCLHVLSVAALTVGSPQIRHLATIGGNLCNASPSADTIPPLLVLESELTVASLHERRSLPLDNFFIGPGQTKLKDDELLMSIKIAHQPQDAAAVFLKHAPRGAMDLAIVSVALKMWKSADQFQVRIALGAVAPTPLRAFQSEELLASSPVLDDDTFRAIAHCAAGEASPISDVRASAEYRKAMVEVLTLRALRQAYASIQQQA
jgi:CO/xanthine dehydrogenase FAD-binding subunit